MAEGGAGEGVRIVESREATRVSRERGNREGSCSATESAPCVPAALSSLSRLTYSATCCSPSLLHRYRPLHLYYCCPSLRPSCCLCWVMSSYCSRCAVDDPRTRRLQNGATTARSSSGELSKAAQGAKALKTYNAAWTRRRNRSLGRSWGRPTTQQKRPSV